MSMAIAAKVYNPLVQEAVNRMTSGPNVTKVLQIKGKYVWVEFEKDGKICRKLFNLLTGEYSVASEDKFITSTIESPGKDSKGNEIERKALMIFENGIYTKYMKPLGEKIWRLVVKQPLEVPSVLGKKPNYLELLNEEVIRNL